MFPMVRWCFVKIKKFLVFVLFCSFEFVSVDTKSKVALIGCLPEPAAGLVSFSGGRGFLAALVKQYIGLIGLKLVL